METWLYRLGQALGVSLLAVSLSGCQHAGAQAPAAMASGVTITLSGQEEVPPISTGAAGTGMIRVASDRTVSGKLTYSGVTATMAHIHHGSKGSNGPPIVTLTKVSDSAFTVPEGARLTEEQYSQYRAGNLYVNIHSQRYPNGELRGQLRAE